MRAPPLRIIGAVLLVVLGIWAGEKFRSAQNRAPTLRGIPVPAGVASPANPSDLAQGPGEMPGGWVPAKIPDRLPNFSLEDRAGKMTPIAKWGDKSLIINFWATWCAPCRSEIPLLKSLNSEWAPRGVSVVGIAVDDRDKVIAFAERFKIGYPLLIGEQGALDAAAKLGVQNPVFPFTVFTDRRGEVVALFVGEIHRSQAELILAQVDALNAGKTELGAARHAIADGLARSRGALE